MSSFSEGFMYDYEFIHSKRYARFVDKTQEALLEWGKKYFSPDDVSFAGIMYKLFVSTIFDDDSPYALEQSWKNFMYVPDIINFTAAECKELDLFNYKSYKEFVASSTRFYYVYNQALYNFCFQWINEKAIANERITEETFIQLSVPSTDVECAVFAKRLFQFISNIILMSSAVQQNPSHKTHQDYMKLREIYRKTCQQMSTIRSDNTTLRKKNHALQTENNRFKSEQKKTEKQQKSENDLVASQEEEIARQNGVIRKLNARLEDIQGKYDALKEQVQILEAEAEYEEEYIETEFNRQSKLLFVCDRPSCGGIQRTYDRILNAFPNSNMVHDTPTSVEMYDGIVLLTRYMSHHFFYWDTRDFCKNHNIPCRHCDKQGVELVIADIVNRKRYKAISG